MEDLFSGFDGEGLTSAETEQLSINKTPNNIKKSKRKTDLRSPSASSATIGNIAADSSTENHDATKRSRASAPSPYPAVSETATSIKAETDDVSKMEVDVKTEGSQSKPRRPPAKIYPFELDGFQRESVGYLENDESVLVSAHTSAGKTAVAEYAIAMALRDGQRVVYTSPIKALSNQKYRDLHAEFSDVGLMTGDVTINPNASCLVMTTEILRSMLYRGSEILREVAWAIFDEVHYMRDKDRGVVWEESIILLPHKVKYVFLSATIPNGAQFCRWISKTHNQPCHIVYTEYRPTPLQHFVFPAGGEALYMVVDENTKFLEDKWAMAMSGLATSGDKIQDEVMSSKDKKDAAKKRNAQKSTKLKDLERVIKLILEKKYDPVIVFSFSKKECELYATRLAKEDMTTPDEKALIKEIFVNAIDGLSDDDKELPSIKSLLPLLQHGVGIHHGGLLPILKEVTEILFGEGLLKVLVATETFAMGINMPAKTVVFTALRKFDGQDFRYVTAGEYIQMSGRAGRRGKDDRGIVIMLADEKIEAPEAKDMMTGQADALSSTFHLGYNMLLNLFRVEEPEYMIRNSLHMFQREEVVPALKAKHAEFDKEHDAIDLGEHVDAIRELYHLSGQVDKVRKQMREIVNKPAIALPFCQAGRLVQVKDDARDDHWGWGVVVGTAKVKAAAPATSGASSSAAVENVNATVNVVHVLLPTSASSAETSNPKPGDVDDKGVMSSDTILKVVPCVLATLDGFSSVRLVLPKDIRKQAQLAGVWRAVQEVKRRFKGSIPALDPVKDMKVVDSKLTNLLTDIHGLEKQVRECAANKLPTKTRDVLLAKHVERVGIRARQKVIEKEIKVTESLPMRDQLKRMKVVMRRLGLITKENAVDLKGRVACEIAACDELLATELVFGGAFNDLTPEVTAALVSCLIYTERGDKEVRVRSELQGPLNTLQVAARRVAEIQKDAKIDIDVDEYVQSFRADLMEPVYQWCNGAKFGDVMQMTEIFEGTIVRCVRRQEELMRQLVGASRVIGDTALENKFKAAIKLIHRDVAFAASLYL